MTRCVFIALISIVCVGCASHYRDTTLFHRTGGTKPIVAVLPMIDNSGEKKVTWDVSEELTERIQKRVVDSAKLYLLKGKGNVHTATLLNSPDPTALPADISQNLGAAEFAIVTELLNQDELLHSHPEASDSKKYLKETGGQLHLAIRMRVIDLRKETPKVVLQEVVVEDHDIMRPYLNIDYRRYRWGGEAYERTPMGMAHSKIVRELVAHAEGYIGANRG